MYDYKIEKPKLLTIDILGMYIKAKNLTKINQVVTMEALVAGASGHSDTWYTMATVDYHVEHKFLTEIQQANVAGQHRIFRIEE